MHRLNFGRKSGIILDSCRPHGLWFDANELDAVVRWIRTGGESETRRRAALGKPRPTLETAWSRSATGSGSLLEVLGWVVDRILDR